MKDFALFPPAASNFAGSVDQVTIALLLLCGGMVALVFGLILFFGVRYRKGSPHSRARKERADSLLEWGWTFATLFLFLGLFVWGAHVYVQMHVPPRDALRISALGKQWMWTFEHPDGTRELNELHVPAGRPILLTMTSQDVIHSFFVPEFRVKQDVLPGRYTYVWFTPNKIGKYHLFCTQYCGLAHADMGGSVHVQAPAEYERWREGYASRSALADSESLPPQARGERLFRRLGCVTCHVQGRREVAPDLTAIYGREVELNNGAKVVADDNYLRDHILDPRQWLVKGYPPLMPSFRGQVNEDDLLSLITYIRSLNGKEDAAP